MSNRFKVKLGIVVYILFLIININSVEAYYNNIQFKNITIEDGLPQSSVEALYQDSKGYIWAGTNDGLSRYNGYDFKVYKSSNDSDNSIANNYILHINEDKNGNIWVGTVNGLSKISSYDGKVTNYYKDKDKGNLSDNSICEILVLDNGEILVSTGNGLNLYNKERDSFTRILSGSNYLSNQDIYSMTQDEEGNIWLGTYNGLNKINIKEKNIQQFYNTEDENSISENTIQKVYSDKKGYVWVGTLTGGLNKINIKTNEVSRYKYDENDNTSLPDNQVKNILRDKDNTVWICTGSGLARYVENDESFINYTNEIEDRHSLLNNLIFSIIQDKEGLIWLGTYEGISLFNPSNKIEYYKRKANNVNSLSSNVIHGIYEDEDGMVWVGTKSEGINILDRETNNVVHITEKDGLSSNSINFITGKDKYIWVGTRDGLNRIDKNSKEIKVYNTNEGLVSGNVKGLLIDDKHNLWIGSIKGLNILNIETEEIIDITNDLKNYGIEDEYIRTIYQDEKGCYWIGTFKDGYLAKISAKDQTIKNYKDTNLPKNKSIDVTSVRSINEDKNYIWIGSDEGLYRINKFSEEIKAYTEKDGLVNNTIYGVLVDNNYNLWISTNNGISKFDVVKETFTNYNISDGFQGNEFNGGAFFKSKDGEMLFGGINGLNIFNPKDLETKMNPQKVVFEEFEVNTNPYNNIDKMEFNYDENIISMKFFQPNFRNIKNIKYYYKLEGIDADFNVTNNNQVIYRNLKSGKYTFKVKAVDNSGSISDETSISFTIKPHFLLSTTALVIYTILIGIAIINQRNKVKRLDALVEKRTAQLRQETKVSEELLKKVIELEKNKNNYFVNISHELRTPINVIYTTIQLLLEYGKRDDLITKDKLNYHANVMQKNTSRLLNLINNIIDTSKIEHGSYKINIKEEDIVYIVEETALGLKDYIEEKDIVLIIDPEVEEKIIECDRYEIERCIVNLVGNARKFTNEGGTITVKIKDLDNEVLISVKDSGVGIDEEHQKYIFDRFNQVVDEHSEIKGGSGLGLTITKHIVNLHGGKISVSSEVGKGTTFTIILPVKVKKI